MSTGYEWSFKKTADNHLIHDRPATSALGRHELCRQSVVGPLATDPGVAGISLSKSGARALEDETLQCSGK